jgi:hypothetical protein
MARADEALVKSSAPTAIGRIAESVKAHSLAIPRFAPFTVWFAPPLERCCTLLIGMR